MNLKIKAVVLTLLILSMVSAGLVAKAEAAATLTYVGELPGLEGKMLREAGESGIAQVAPTEIETAELMESHTFTPDEAI